MNVKTTLALLTLALAFASCSSMPSNQTSNAHASTDPTTPRTPAQAAPEVRVLSLEDGMQKIAQGAPFDMTCKHEKNFRPMVHLAIYPTGVEATSYQMDTDLAEFGKQLFSTNPRTLNSGKSTYRASYHSLYSYRNANTPIRIYDVRESMFTNCSRVEEGESQSDMAETISLLSLVGPYASFDFTQSGYGEGAAHPFAGRNFVAKNALETKTSPKNQNTVLAMPAHLEALVDNASLLSALKADSFLQKRGGTAFRSARSLDQVAAALAKRMDCDVYFPEKAADLLAGFAIFDYPVNGNQVAVRVGLGYGCEAMRGNLTQLGLVVKPSAEFRAELDAEVAQAARENRKPYFMKNQLNRPSGF